MTSVQLRYSGSANGLDWLVEDLRDVGLDPRFPPPDNLGGPSLDETVELVLDLRRTGDEGRLQAISDPGGLEVIDNAIASFADRFEFAAATPVVTIVGVQSNPSTAAAVVLKNPSLAFCTDVECGCAEDDLVCDPPLPPPLVANPAPRTGVDQPAKGNIDSRGVLHWAKAKIANIRSTRRAAKRAGRGL